MHGWEDEALPAQVRTRGTTLHGTQPRPGPPLASLLPPQNEAVEMMDQIAYWVREDPSGLGRPCLPGAPASESMAVPMMLLNLVDQLGEADEELAGTYAELGDWCAQRILQHVQVGGTPGGGSVDRRLTLACWTGPGSWGVG